MDNITAIGVDEIQYRKGHRYMTLVYQIDEDRRRLLWIGKERTQASFRGFLEMLGTARSHAIQFVCSDMWKAYLNVIAECAPQALNILDKFHIARSSQTLLMQPDAKKFLDCVSRANRPFSRRADGRYSPIVRISRPRDACDDGRPANA